ncbi:MAG: Ppx/GppA family phosphatase, partial [Pseudomonadota bacterium]|nr:Ppx/GppA family phosphatase [Pseudomonadota bacterium]
MSEDNDRFEFRAFARNFGIVEDRLRRLSRNEGIQEQFETYLIAAGHDNVKVRDGRLEIKTLVQRRNGLEQWTPRIKESFPVAAAVLRDHVLPALKVELALAEPEYSLERFLHELIRPAYPAVVCVNVFKRRASFTVGECRAELTEVWINGAGVQTVAVESADPQA